jgi:hypothetical protein
MSGATICAKTNQEFLSEKLNNYKAFLKSVAKNTVKIEELEKFSLDHFLIFGATTLMPLHASGNAKIAVDKTLEMCEIDDVPAVREKLGRYYEFLVAFLQKEKDAYYSSNVGVAEQPK